MRDAPAFAIHQNIGHGRSFASEKFVDDILFLIVTETVYSDDAQSGSVTYHIAIDYLSAFLALELLGVILAVDAVGIKLEIVTFIV